MYVCMCTHRSLSTWMGGGHWTVRHCFQDVLGEHDLESCPQVSRNLQTPATTVMCTSAWLLVTNMTTFALSMKFRIVMMLAHQGKNFESGLQKFGTRMQDVKGFGVDIRQV